MASKIEKGIPVPENARTPGSYSRHPWKEMEVGDSFFVTGLKTAPGAPKAIRDEGKKFTHAEEENAETGETGWRVWRTA